VRIFLSGSRNTLGAFGAVSKLAARRPRSILTTLTRSPSSGRSSPVTEIVRATIVGTGNGGVARATRTLSRGKGGKRTPPLPVAKVSDLAVICRGVTERSPLGSVAARKIREGALPGPVAQVTVRFKSTISSTLGCKMLVSNIPQRMKII